MLHVRKASQPNFKIDPRQDIASWQLHLLHSFNRAENWVVNLPTGGSGERRERTEFSDSCWRRPRFLATAPACSLFCQFERQCGCDHSSIICQFERQWGCDHCSIICQFERQWPGDVLTPRLPVNLRSACWIVGV